MSAAPPALSETNLPANPAELGWPPTLPVEVALRTASIKNICESYNLSRSDWDALRTDPLFIQDVAAAHEALRKDGMSFRTKARLQAEELLKRSWQMIHDRTGATPPAVAADLIKFTIRAAGLDGSKEAASGGQNNLQININLG